MWKKCDEANDGSWDTHWFQSHTFESEVISGNWMTFKNNRKCFLFDLESSIRYEDIQLLFWQFWSYRKTAGLES